MLSETCITLLLCIMISSVEHEDIGFNLVETQLIST